MPAERVCAREASSTTPLVAGLERTFADEFLLTAVEAFVALAIVLSCESFAAHRANEGSFVRVRSQMTTQIIRSREALRAKITLEGRRMLLDSTVLCAVAGTTLGLREVEDVVALVGSVARASGATALAC